MKHVLLALVALTACATDDLTDDVVDSEPIARYTDPGEPTCPLWGCGANSATVGDGLIFDELDSSGSLPNRGGLSIVSSKLADGRAVTLRVYRHWLYATDSYGGFYSGMQLNGAIMTLKHPVKGYYEVLVVAEYTQALTFWAGAHEAVPSYEFKTRRKGELKFTEYACRSEITADPNWTGPIHNAVVFQWDRYDAQYKTASETASDDPWFNLACAGTAPAKMHLTRHTRAGSTDVYGTTAWPTTVAQRTAMLKMFTADYCGTGHTFTVDGTPLYYTDRAHYMPNITGTPPPESLWDQYGAFCLENPRYVDRQLVDDKCGYHLPDCGTITGWEWWANVYSALR